MDFITNVEERVLCYSEGEKERFVMLDNDDKDLVDIEVKEL
jgi:hypothetical protein